MKATFTNNSMTNEVLPGQAVDSLRAKNLGAAGMAILNSEKPPRENGAPFFYDSVVFEGALTSGISESEPRRITTPGEGYIITDCDTKHYVIGGEMMPVLTGAYLQEPTPEIRAMMLGHLANALNLDLFDQCPRLAHLLTLYENHNSGEMAQGAAQDYAWLHMFRKKALGGDNPTGYYETVNPYGTDGYGALEYCTGLWGLIAYLRNPTPSTWSMWITFMLAHAAYQIEHTGKHAGMAVYPKGYGVCGRGDQPSWGKQYAIGLFAWYALTRHPLLGLAVEAHRKAVLAVKTDFWSGSWGERIPGWWFESALCVAAMFGVSTVNAKAQAVFDHCMHYIGPDGFFVSREGYTSPWMQFKLIAAMAKWQRLGVGIQYDLDAVLTALETTCVDKKDGMTRVAYRWYPRDVSGSHVSTHTACLIAAQLAVRGHSPILAEWDARIGGSWTGPVPALSTLGMRHGPQGPGWLKAVPICLLPVLAKKKP